VYVAATVFVRHTLKSENQIHHVIVDVLSCKYTDIFRCRSITIKTANRTFNGNFSSKKFGISLVL
jgi:hypothetical protein